MSKTNPNWLLMGLIIFSLVIHIFIFMHVAGIYRAGVLDYIELTMRDVSKPYVRSIPRPRHRPKELEKPREFEKLVVAKRIVPKLKPARVEKVEKDLPDSIVERINSPELDESPAFNLSDWAPESRVDTSDYATASDYFDMLRIKIESLKEYPTSARVRNIEGRATIGFVVNLDGSLSDVRIVKSSSNKALDQAAISAVEKAAPFPRPPLSLFDGPIALELTIVFELT